MTNSSRLRRAIALVALVLALGACSNEDLIRMSFAAEGATPAQQDQAVAVARCESSLNHAVTSPGGGNWGLFQINKVHAARVNALGFGWHEMLHPWQNSIVAADIWAEQGWRPWTCARHLGF